MGLIKVSMLSVSLVLSLVQAGPTPTCSVDPDEHHHIFREFAKHIVSRFNIKEHEENFRFHKKELDDSIELLREIAESGHASNVHLDTIGNIETNVIQASGIMSRVEDDLTRISRDVSTSTGSLLKQLRLFKGQSEHARKSTHRNILSLVTDLAHDNHDSLIKELEHISKAKTILYDVKADIVFVEAELKKANKDEEKKLITTGVKALIGIFGSLIDGKGDGGFDDVSTAIEESGIVDAAGYYAGVSVVSSTLHDGFSFFSKETETVKKEEKDVENWKRTLGCMNDHEGDVFFDELSELADDDVAEWNVLVYDIQQAHTYASSFQ